MGFTKIDNYYLDNPNGLTLAEFRVMICLERLLTGFHRRSYKIAYSELSKMSGVVNVYRVMKLLKKKGFVSFESEDGKSSNIQINKPSQSVSRSSKKASTSVSRTIAINDIHHSNQLYDPPLAKENYKENLKKDDLLLEFNNKYPKEKIDDELDDVWSSLSDDHKRITVGVMEYQNNKWDDPNFNRQYIPKASNFILKQLYLDDKIKKPYDDEIRRKKEIRDHKRYLEEADKNSATEIEIKEILSKTFNR